MATALYRRYRPESFAEVIGQDHVTTPLRRALRAGRIGHAYLFSGPRGCGKTTSARILARCLNCAEGPTDTPCGVCDSCRDLARGGAGSLDVVEIDAASHGGVDDARELRERASFAPVRDRYKVFIIDEAHMVTSAGFNALLKLVEEPPDHVKFVFATTEPDKVIGTIRSRTHHYPFRLIPPQVLGPYLEQVCGREGVQVGDGVLPLVVRAGGGSARDSMSVLDQLMAGAGDEGLDHRTAIALLGFTDTALLDRATMAIAERDAATLYDAVEQVLVTGHEPRRFVEDLLERLRDLIILAAVPDRAADLLPQIPADELDSMRAQAAAFVPADLSLCGDLIHETLSTMSGATSPRLHLELLAARLVLRDQRAGAVVAAPTGGNPAGAPGENAGGGRPAGAYGGGAGGQGGQGGPGASGAPAVAGPGAAGPGAGAPGGGASSGGGREEARRIAQERAEASRRARGEAPARRPEPAQPAPSAAPASAAPASAAQASAAPAPAAAAASWGDAVRQAAPAAEPVPAPQAADAPPAQPAAAPAPQAPAAPAQVAQPVQPQASQPQASQPQAAAPQAAPAPAGGDADAVRGHWSAILDELAQIRRPSWALVAQNGHVQDLQGSTLLIGFRTEGLVSAFRRGTAAQNLSDAVRRIMHLDVTVEPVVGEDPGPGSGGTGGSGGGPTGPGGGAGGHAGGAPGGQAGGAPGGQSGGGPGGNGHGGPTNGAPAPRWGDAAPAMTGASTAAASAAPASVPSAASVASAPSTSTTSLPTSWAPASAASAPAEPVSAAPTPEPVAPAQAPAQRSATGPAFSAPSTPPSTASTWRGDDRVEDFAPEPDDPYPPDPEDFYPPDPQEFRDASPQRPQHQQHQQRQVPPLQQSAGPAPSPAQSSPAAPAPAEAPVPVPASAAPASAPASATPARAAVAGADGVPEVEDEGRDSIPEGEPRTFGQRAIKQALAEGRVVRSLPAAASSAPAAPAAAPDPVPAPAAESAPAAPAPSGPGTTAPAPSAAADAGWGAPAVQPSAPRDERTGSMTGGSATGSAATSSASTSWSTAAGQGSVAPAAPVAPAPSSGPSAAPATGPSAARSGIQLAREAAQASRAAAATGGRRFANTRHEEPAPAAPVDEDPTGGASRDDADASYTSRSGREVIEAVLGGKVLEIIDETR